MLRLSTILHATISMIALFTTVVLALQALATVAVPSPAHVVKRDVVRPEVLKAELIANVTDPNVSRDSCVSTKIKTRTLWTCRDTTLYDAKADAPKLPIVVNTAAWTDFNKDGTPKIITDGPVGSSSNGSNPILQMYGKPDVPSKIPFYPLTQPDACTITAGGKCEDGSRTVVWQDSAPMVQSSNSKGKTTAFTWIANWHLDKLVSRVKQPSYSLYKMTYDNTNPDKEALPVNKLVDPEFWEPGSIGYGAYGRVVHKGVAYLYGQGLYRNTALAKVPLASLEDKSKYQYYVNGAWTKTKPSISDTSAWIPNAGASKQGRFYYSEAFDSFMWIGQRNMSFEADFYLTTAPAPEGPWIKPYLIYSGLKGDGPFGAYSLQAHPALLKNGKERGIYLTWTQEWDLKTYGSYVNPLAYVTFK